LLEIPWVHLQLQKYGRSLFWCPHREMMCERDVQTAECFHRVRLETGSLCNCIVNFVPGSFTANHIQLYHTVNLVFLRTIRDGQNCSIRKMFILTYLSTHLFKD
jgi:hypothetical protein